MDVDRFTRERAAGWDELQGLVRAAGSRPQRLASEPLLRLGRRYRAAAADLALARRLYPGIRSRGGSSASSPTPASPSTRPSRAAGRCVVPDHRLLAADLAASRAVLAGLALLFVPMALAAVWAIDDPAAALGIVPGEFHEAAEPGGGGGLSTGEEAAFSSEIYTNNIRATFLVVRRRRALGLGSAAVTIFNGGFIGAIFGLTIENGTFDELLRFVLPHGLLELSCIAVSCAAGLRLGWAIIDPGRSPGRVAAARGAHGGRDRARDDAVARAGGSDRGLRQPEPAVPRRSRPRSGSRR